MFMKQPKIEFFQNQERSNWVRLQTLVTLRWMAIAGQTSALLVSVYLFNLQFQIGLASATVGASVIANLFVTFKYPKTKRLKEREAMGMVGFDLVQLSALIFLTGGLNNPFALLIIAPVTIAATVLHLRSTLILGGFATCAIAALTFFHQPIITSSGRNLELPLLLQFGFPIALLIGVVFLAIYVRQVTTEMHNMSEALLATKLALAREQKLTDLGGVVAAAAHELGTPLATIMLVSGELQDELAVGSDQHEDAMLIHDQAKRCREILASMGRAGKDDLLLRNAPLESIAKEAAEPHLNRGKTVEFISGPMPGVNEPHPEIQRRPEIVHGLRNLVQNAVDFADHKVEIRISWSAEDFQIEIADDGLGFPPSVLRRIGDPFVRRWRQSETRSKRPGYDGMGLGLFIAKTLLERTGAVLNFQNGNSPSKLPGAMITVRWLTKDDRTVAHAIKGTNQNFTPH